MTDPLPPPSLLGDGMPELVSALAAASSGLSFIYEVLDGIAGKAGERVSVVVPTPSGGLQRFASGRRGRRAEAIARVVPASPGLFIGERRCRGPEAEAIVGLVGLAVELDRCRHEAAHDPLTGLENRRAFDVALDELSARAARYGWQFALVLLDLDGFKQLNDRRGHVFGDRVLAAMGAELAQMVRAGDVAARVGGDEFALLLAGSDASGLAPVLARLGQRLASRLGPDVAFSAGAAFAPNEGVDPETLFSLADQRLYRAKPGGARWRAGSP
jgi:diguanylate cyclase (GGDEF)-like protein